VLYVGAEITALQALLEMLRAKMTFAKSVAGFDAYLNSFHFLVKPEPSLTPNSIDLFRYPRTYADLSSQLKELQLYVEAEMLCYCTTCKQLIYRGTDMRHPSRHRCPASSEHTIARCFYVSLVRRLKILVSHFRDMIIQAGDPSSDAAGLAGGTSFARLKQERGIFSGATCDILLSLNADGFLPYGLGSRSTYSTFGVYVKIVNWGRGAVYAPLAMLPVMFIQPCAADFDQTVFLDYAIQEMIEMSAPFQVADVRARAFLVAVCADLRAMTKLSKRPSTPSTHACHYCSHEGTHNPVAGTTVYGFNGKSTSSMLQCIRERAFSHEVFLSGWHGQTDSRSRVSPFAALGYVRLNEIFALDPMHLLFHGVYRRSVKVLFGEQQSSSSAASASAPSITGAMERPPLVPVTPQQRRDIMAAVNIINRWLPRKMDRPVVQNLGQNTASMWRTLMHVHFPLAFYGRCDQNGYGVLRHLLEVVARLFLFDGSMSDAGQLAELGKLESRLVSIMREYEAIYGTHNCTINTHHLLHLPLILKRMGNLEEVWNFAFERLNKTMGDFSRQCKKSPEMRMAKYAEESFVFNVLSCLGNKEGIAVENCMSSPLHSDTHQSHDQVSVEDSEEDGRDIGGHDMDGDGGTGTAPSTRLADDHHDDGPLHPSSIPGVNDIAANIDSAVVSTDNFDLLSHICDGSCLADSEKAVINRFLDANGAPSSEEQLVKCSFYGAIRRRKDGVVFTSLRYLRAKKSCDYAVATLGEHNSKSDVWYGFVKDYVFLNSNAVLARMHWVSEADSNLFTTSSGLTVMRRYSASDRMGVTWIESIIEKVILVPITKDYAPKADVDIAALSANKFACLRFPPSARKSHASS